MKLRIRAFGLAMGIFGAIVWFLLPVVSMVRGGSGIVIQNIALIAPGYDRTIVGAVFGIIWGFIEGAIAGVVIAWLYNRFHKMLYKTEAGH